MSAFGGTEVCSDSTHHKTWGARVYSRVPLDERRKYPSVDPLAFFRAGACARHTCAVSCGRVNSKGGSGLGTFCLSRWSSDVWSSYLFLVCLANLLTR